MLAEVRGVCCCIHRVYSINEWVKIPPLTLSFQSFFVVLLYIYFVFFPNKLKIAICRFTFADTDGETSRQFLLCTLHKSPSNEACNGILYQLFWCCLSLQFKRYFSSTWNKYGKNTNPFCKINNKYCTIEMFSCNRWGFRVQWITQWLIQHTINRPSCATQKLRACVLCIFDKLCACAYEISLSLLIVFLTNRMKTYCGIFCESALLRSSRCVRNIHFPSVCQTRLSFQFMPDEETFDKAKKTSWHRVSWTSEQQVWHVSITFLLPKERVIWPLECMPKMSSMVSGM